MVSLESRVLMCTCRGCYLLFTDESARLRYRAVPDRFLSFPDLDPSGGGWAALEIPVGLAFLFQNSVQERVVAFYPGPAGATESDLPLASWDEIVAASPELGTLRPDVEALLIRTPDHEQEGSVHLVPIDRCYELVGRLRTPVARVRRWTGRPGGHRRVLRDGGRQEQARRAVHEHVQLHDRRHLRRAVRRDAAADRRGCGSRRAPARRSTRSRCAARCASSPRSGAYDVADETGLRALFGDRDRWTDTLKPFLWMQAGAMVQGFTDITEVDLPAAVHLRLRPDRLPLPARGRRGRDPDRAAVQRHHLHQGCERLRRRAGAVGLRGVVPPAGQRLAPDDRLLLPEHRLAPARPRRADRVGRLPVAARADDVGGDRGRAARRRRTVPRHEHRPGQGGRGRRALRGLPALPLPRELQQEPVAVAVRRARPAERRAGAFAEEHRMEMQCLLEPDLAPPDPRPWWCGCASCTSRSARSSGGTARPTGP